MRRLEGRIGHERIVLPAPTIGQVLGFRNRGKNSVFRNSFLNRLLNDSTKPVFHGDPGLMWAERVQLLVHQRLRALAMN